MLNYCSYGFLEIPKAIPYPPSFSYIGTELMPSGNTDVARKLVFSSNMIFATVTHCIH